MDRFTFILARLRERLWIRPALWALTAISMVALAVVFDYVELPDFLPHISDGMLDKLLSIISTTMLGVATFAVASMVSAYASASQSATPRALKLIIADNMSQRALSSFIGAYIFSIVASIAVQSGLLKDTGNFILFVATLSVIFWVIVTFVTWVDSIARLGRMGDTIAKVDDAVATALDHWAPDRRLGAANLTPKGATTDITANRSGHVQHVDLGGLQEWAEEHDAHIFIDSQPGRFLVKGDALARVETSDEIGDEDLKTLHDAFIIDSTRSFTDDPRFGLIALSEIASRALSPGINDPGTAIDVIKRVTETLADWGAKLKKPNDEPTHPRLSIPELSIADCLEDAFHGIERDGAQNVEVAIWLQKAYDRLTRVGHRPLTEAARHRAAVAMQRAEQEMNFDYDIERLREVRDRLTRD